MGDSGLGVVVAPFVFSASNKAGTAARSSLSKGKKKKTKEYVYVRYALDIQEAYMLLLENSLVFQALVS